LGVESRWESFISEHDMTHSRPFYKTEDITGAFVTITSTKTASTGAATWEWIVSRLEGVEQYHKFARQSELRIQLVDFVRRDRLVRLYYSKGVCALDCG